MQPKRFPAKSYQGLSSVESVSGSVSVWNTNMTLLTTRRSLLAIIAILALAAGMAAFGVDSASAKGKSKAIAITGIGTVNGESVVVHIIAVVPEGKSKKNVAAAALRGVNARGLTSSDFSLLANAWDQFSDGDPGNDFVTQRYNSKNEPSGAQAVIEAARSTWTAADSPFAFEAGMVSTGKCPSLVDECKGRQSFDGNNDMGWVKLRDQNTLAVTWSGTVTDESDVAFNTNFSWSTDDVPSAINIETVALHELGHVAGIGHSEVLGSIMEPVYAGIRRTLEPDDIEALQAWYGSSGGPTPPPTPEPEPTPDPSPTPTPTPPSGELHVGAAGYVDGDGVAYSLSGKKGRDLIITITITDGTGTVSGATVSITATNEGGWSGSGSGTTNSSGEARFKVRRAPSGVWSTTVNSASSGSLSCATDCPDGPHLGTK